MATPSGPPKVTRAPIIEHNADQAGWASKDDWVKHQALIAQLYKKHVLAEVMDIMSSQHGFRATVKMYKTRIRQWGLDKKNKENEMRAIVRKNKHLGDQGKPASFRVRGRMVDYKDVIRYWERKGVQIDDAIAQRTQSKTPEAVECFISLPSPTVMSDRVTNLDRILVTIRDYFKGSFESWTWLAKDPQGYRDTTKVQEDAVTHLVQLETHIAIACMLFANNHFQEAGRCLILATSKIKEIILAEHPMSLTFLFGMIASTFQKGREAIGLAIIRQFSALAEILMCERHPLHCIFDWLVSMLMNPSQIEDTISRCKWSIGNNFENLLGPMNWCTLESRLRFVDVVEVEHDVNLNRFLLQDTLRKCEATIGPFDIRTLSTRLRLAEHYWENLDNFEATRLGWDVVSYADRLENPYDIVRYKAGGLYVIAHAQYAMDETYWAEVYLREAIDLRILQFGPDDDRVRIWLMNLEGWLQEQGQLSAAAQVHRRWKESLRDSTDDS